jgi:hypothetical protein
LATAYRIEVETDSGDWITVADASDRKPFEGRNPTADEWELLPAALAGLDPRSRQQAQALLDERLRLERAIAGAVASQQAFAGVFRKPDRIHWLRRGDPEQPGPEVTPAVPEVLGTVRLPADAPEPERRQALARWLTQPDQALIARVMVNRIWQGHFGTGLVDTPSDFGRAGSRPSHPGLLDGLAEGEIETDAERLGLLLGEADGEADGLALGEIEADGEADGEALGLGPSEGDSEAEAERLGLKENGKTLLKIILLHTNT